ncbi:MAG: ABC transporter permease subunit [Bacillota bacterium]
MQLQRWTRAILQRFALFLCAGLIAVLLLHVQAGVIQVPAGASTFSTSQWLSASGEYLSQVIRGELGTLQPLRVTGYMQEKPVAAELQGRAPASLLLLALGLVVSLAGGTLLGLLGSRFGAGWLRPPTLLGTLLLLSTPDILVVLGLRALVVWFLSAFGLKLFSLTALGASLQPSHFIAPTLALAALPLAVVARVAAVAFDEVHDQLYIRTARAKGATPLRVILRHALKNGWIRVAEAGPLVMAALVTGLVVVEYILYFPGIGRTLGLILEKGGQPTASSSIAVLLLGWAVLIDIAFAAIRLALDPRLEEHRRPEARGPAAALPAGQWVRSLGTLPRALAHRVREWPAALAQAAWIWRPSRLWKELLTNPPLLLGLTGVGALAVIALFGGRFLDLSTAHRIPAYIVTGGEVFFPPYKPGTPGYPLGSDMAGRDLLARLVVGARYTLFFTLAVTPVRFLVALPWGLAAGLTGGLWRQSARTLGLVFSALPVLLIPAALLPLVPVLGHSSSYWLITAILAAAGIPRLVENIRQHAEAVAVQPFLEGARAAGAGSGRIFWRYLFPHLLPQLWVIAAADMAWTLLLLAQFGVFSIFLAGSVTVMTGFEVMSNSKTIAISRIPDWSSMLSRPYDVIYQAPWSIWVPALCFLAAIIAFNLVAEGLRRRAQALQALPLPEESPRARRRLLLEWAATGAVLVMLTGLTLNYGTASPAYAFGEEAKSPLDMARLELRAVLELASGTAPDLDRSRAAGALKGAVTTYLKELQAAGLPLTEIEADTQGRISLIDGDGYLLLNAYLPNLPSKLPSYVFVVEKRSGQLIDRITTSIKVNHFTVLPKAGRHTQGSRMNPTDWIVDYVILAGPIPEMGDRWGLSVWAGAYDQTPRLAYSNQSSFVSSLYDRQGEKHDLQVVKAGYGGGYVLVTPTSQSRFTVAGNGDLAICRQADGPCATFPWLGPGWVHVRSAPPPPGMP